jgi:PAS domain S-box-containing protein
LVRKDGELRYGEMSVTIMKDMVGRPRSLGQLVDITERKQAEEALRESEQKFRSIVEQASDAIVICDEQGIIVEFNRAAEQFTGRKQRDMLGKYFWDAQFEFMPEENRTPTALEQFRSMGMEALQTGQATWFNQALEGNIQRPDGTYRHFQQVIFPIQTAKGFMLGSFSRDITERKLAEEALVIKDYAIGSSINAIAIANLAANLTYVNPSFLKLWGYDTEEDVLGRPAVSFWSEPEKAGEIVEVLQHRKSWQGELGAIRKDGSIFVAQLSASLVLDTSGQPVNMMASFVDITHEKQAIEEREQLIEELEAKNTELERFTYTVSHDLKSPLVTIKGFLGLLEKDIVKGDTLRIQGDISHIRDASETMQLLLDDLLELSRIGRLVNPAEEVHLSELAREGVKLVAGQIAERGVQVDLHPNLPIVYGDRPRLLEVYQNLIQNAVKFMGHQPEPRIEIGVKEEGKNTIFYVRDNGIGIEPRYQDKVFDLFDRLDPSVEGTGIGLALVKRIVEVHGGRVWVESEGPDQGSTFYFTLPNEQAD